MKEAQKGYTRVAVLNLLSQKPHHGYEIMKEIRDKTKGFWKPTAGGVYPILRDLEESGYFEGEWSSQKKPKNKGLQDYRNWQGRSQTRASTHAIHNI